MIVDFKNKLDESVLAVEEALSKYLSSLDSEKNLKEAAKYSLLNGGKRIRAFLTLNVCEMFGGKKEAALPLACAVEMVHAYSLIHDDLPAMDNDDFRRGKPSCHKAFGEATALLAGDSLLTLAFETAASDEYISDSAKIKCISLLSKMAGIEGMCAGQAIDLAYSADTFDELKHLHKLKTGCLIKAACLMGLYAADENAPAYEIESISSYADSIGLAFQIQDDILDVTANEEELGKPVGSDEKNDKKTSLKFMSLDEASAFQNELTLKAIDSVNSYPKSEGLIQLAVYLSTRKK